MVLSSVNSRRFVSQNSRNAIFAARKLRYRPCRILSASCRFPNSHAFKKPCSERSMFFIDVMSCAGGRLTREATTTGSVSRMIPSSTSSSTARDCHCQLMQRLEVAPPTTRS